MVVAAKMKYSLFIRLGRKNIWWVFIWIYIYVLLEWIKMDIQASRVFREWTLAIWLRRSRLAAAAVDFSKPGCYDKKKKKQIIM